MSCCSIAPSSLQQCDSQHPSIDCKEESGAGKRLCATLCFAAAELHLTVHQAAFGNGDSQHPSIDCVVQAIMSAWLQGNIDIY
jgi:hypothetical protein